MIKSRSTLKTLEEFLQKTRRRLSDEDADYSDMDEIDDEQDPDAFDSESGLDDDDEAAQYLKAQEKDQGAEETPEEAPDYSEYEQDEEPKAQKPAAQIKAADVQKPAPTRKIMTPTGVRLATDDELQPTKQELASLREYTRPWEQHARDRAKLTAEAGVNPVLHHQGRLIEARNTSHADRQKAYDEYTKSPEFQNADPISQMEMESKFHDDWHKQNPEHLINALSAHDTAHKKGSEAKQAFAQVKDEKIRHIAGGGVNPDAMSFEEGLQHVGGSHDDEDGGAPSGIMQDKAAAFASGNQEFLQQYMKNYDKRAKKVNQNSQDEYATEDRLDPSDVLGDHPAAKFPDKQKKFNQFTTKYYPLIEKASRHVVGKLGLTDKFNRGEIDKGLLREAGTHAIAQAINDYDHDHPSKAKFTTHLNRKMHGLMQTALKAAQTDIPDALRQGAKRFDKQRTLENMAPVKHTNKEGVTNVIQPAPRRPAAEIAAAHHPDVQDRLKRVAAVKAPLIRKQAALAPAPAAPKRKINFINSSDEGGEE